MARSSACSIEARVEKRRCWDEEDVEDLRFLENILLLYCCDRCSWSFCGAFVEQFI